MAQSLSISDSSEESSSDFFEESSLSASGNRNKLRRLYVEGRYHETIQLADRITLSNPDDEGALFYRSRAQLRLSEAAEVSPIPRVAPRFLVVPPEPRERETLTPVYKRRRESGAAARAAAETERGIAATQDSKEAARRPSRGKSGGVGRALRSIAITGLGLVGLGVLVWGVFALFGRKKSEDAAATTAAGPYAPSPISDYGESEQEDIAFAVPTRAEVSPEQLDEEGTVEVDSGMFTDEFEKEAFKESAEGEVAESSIPSLDTKLAADDSTGGDISLDLPTEEISESPESEVPAEESVGLFDTSGGTEFDIDQEAAGEGAAQDASITKEEPAELSGEGEALLGLGAFKIADGDDTTGPDLPSMIDEDADSASAMDLMEGSGFFGGDEEPEEAKPVGEAMPEASAVDFEGLAGKTGWADLKKPKDEPESEIEEESAAEPPESSHEDLPLSLADVSVSVPSEADSPPESSGIDLALITGSKKASPDSSIEPEPGEGESLLSADSLEMVDEGMESFPMLVGDADDDSESLLIESEAESGEEFGSSQGESPASVGLVDESEPEEESPSQASAEIDETHGHRHGGAAVTTPAEEGATEMEVGSLREEEMSDTETAIGAPADEDIIRIGEGELEGPSDIPPTEKSRPFESSPAQAERIEVHAFHEDETVHLEKEQPDSEDTIFPEPETLDSKPDQDEAARAQTKPSASRPKVSFDPFDKESDLGFDAYEKEQWDKAVHHLSIAAALRPDAVKVREQLRTARRRRKGNPT